MYYNAGYAGQCTWFCWGRAHEKTGKRLTFHGTNSGGQWYKNINTSNVTKRSDSLGPVTNSICSCSAQTTSAGHVIFVELVDGDTVYYTEANANGDNKISRDDGIVKKCSKSSFPPRRKAYGYIVL
ncbi:CHAP domain-containing protein [Crassaminicella indica]|uniref:CHAP domain-containing protein n=1 Tax=Crassaminicella indica TaxID=2855394 RepID=A0ABX8RCQ4_9CLOT|nr:CHAP domain-containing protein [Crassaminicella indica]QXM05500.1 CHAP domain-containing protein [Crassaminicella indica]